MPSVVPLKNYTWPSGESLNHDYESNSRIEATGSALTAEKIRLEIIAQNIAIPTPLRTLMAMFIRERGCF